MPKSIKPLSAQVMVITGATSGIGLATARQAAARGAKLVLAARNAEALTLLGEELRARGAAVETVVCDVGVEAEVKALAARALAAFGGFDTWVNNAGVSIYGRIEDTPIDDQRRLFDTNYWGAVYGSLAALEHLRTREDGGALINVGSVLSDVTIPLQGVYCASKHALKGFTNALRSETRRSAPKVRITLIKPSAIDTPYKEHAHNLTGQPPTNPPPVYATPLVAEAILHAAEHRVRELTVGFGGRALALSVGLAPHLAEPVMAWAAPILTRDRKSNHKRDSDALRAPGKDLRERAPYAVVRKTSLYLAAQTHPEITAGVLFGAGLLLGAVFKARQELHDARVRRDATRRLRAKLESR